MEHFLYFNHFEVGKVTSEQHLPLIAYYNLSPIQHQLPWTILMPKYLHDFIPHKYLDNPLTHKRQLWILSETTAAIGTLSSTGTE